MDLEKYSIFLQHTGTVIDVLERLDQKDGEMFNLFEILGRATDEVMGHSAFIAYLLNSDGESLWGQFSPFTQREYDEKVYGVSSLLSHKGSTMRSKVRKERTDPTVCPTVCLTL